MHDSAQNSMLLPASEQSTFFGEYLKHRSRGSLQKTSSVKNPEGDLESDSMDVLSAMSSTDLERKLLESSLLFIDLYDQYRDRLQAASDTLRETAFVLEMDEETKNLMFLNGFVGAWAGLLFGTLILHYGMVEISIFRSPSIFGASLSGSWIGGTVGAAVACAVGGGEGCPAELVFRSVGGAGFDVLLGISGGLAGVLIGSAFDGAVGDAVGSAAGGALGAVCVAKLTVIAFGHLFGKRGRDESEDFNKKTEEVKIIHRSGRNFHKLLVKQLKTAKKICDVMPEMSSSAAVQSVARQSMNALTAVNTMQTYLSYSLRAKNRVQAAFSMNLAAKQCKRTIKEFDKMRAELKRLSTSLQKS